MKFIMINGPSCVGKSTTVNRILEEREHFYKLSYDDQKWRFSKYDRDTHFEDVQKVIRALANTVAEMGYDIVCDSALYRKNREALFEIVKGYGYEIVEINLEADYDLIAARFDERVANAIANKSKTISNTSKKRFRELFDIYNTEKNNGALTLRTDQLSPEEIVEKISSHIDATR